MIAVELPSGVASASTPHTISQREYLRCYLRRCGLSAREADLTLYDVLENPERDFLARRLSLAPNSITVYRRRIYQKLGLSDWQAVQHHILQLVLQWPSYSETPSQRLRCS